MHTETEQIPDDTSIRRAAMEQAAAERRARSLYEGEEQLGEGERRALVIVDVQRDFCEGGSLAVTGGAAVAEAITTYIRVEGDIYAAVVATKDWHIDPGPHFAAEGEDPDFRGSWPAHCVADTPGAQFHPNLDVLALDKVFHKGAHQAAYSGFEAETQIIGPDKAREQLGLGEWLREHDVTRVDVCGIATDYCVRATAIDSVNLGFATRLLTDLCVGVAEESTQEALEQLREAGVELVSTTALLAHAGALEESQ